MKDLGLKWHVLGRLTIIYILVFAWAIIPVTASKYVSQAEGSSSARVARFGNCEVLFDANEAIVQFGKEASSGHIYGKNYVLKATFTVKYNLSGETATEYSLGLRLGQEGSTYDTIIPIDESVSFSPLSGSLYTSPSSGKTGAELTTAASMTDGKIQSFAEDKFYYSANGTWYEKDSFEPIDTIVAPAGESVEVVYQVLYFVETAVGDTEFPQGVILSNIRAEQVD